MDTSLHSANLTADELGTSLGADEASEEFEAEGAHHIHLPNPSLWPLILSVAIFVAVAGLLFIPDNPWLTIVAAPFVLVGILGWALEDPMATQKPKEAEWRPTTMSQAVLDRAEEVVERTVTFGSTAYSTHPVKVEVEREGVVLALYGKVELETQRKALEEALLKLPNVIDVRNFVVAEDAILNEANARIERLRAQGKLEGANNIEALVENYILNLYGDVPTRDMKYMLERELIGIPGVQVIVNRIGLNEDIPGNLGKTRNR